MFGKPVSRSLWWADQNRPRLGQGVIYVSRAQLAFDSGAVPLVLGPSSWGFGIFPRPGNFYFPGPWNYYLPEVEE